MGRVIEFCRYATRRDERNLAIVLSKDLVLYRSYMWKIIRSSYHLELKIILIMYIYIDLVLSYMAVAITAYEMKDMVPSS